MLDHHLQRSIIYKLSFADSLRFSDLKPDTVDNKLFTYHLKKALTSGLVLKKDDGTYALSPEGRRVSTGVDTSEQQLITERSYSVLFLVTRRANDGAWLFFKRPIHPMRGYKGFMNCNPTSLADAPEAAAQQCRAKTGLNGVFTALGGGFLRMYDGAELESFTHFTLLYCDDIQGELTSDSDSYYWESKPNFTAVDIFPSTQVLRAAYEAKQPFFIEQTFQLEHSVQT